MAVQLLNVMRSLFLSNRKGPADYLRLHSLCFFDMTALSQRFRLAIGEKPSVQVLLGATLTLIPPRPRDIKPEDDLAFVVPATTDTLSFPRAFDPSVSSQLHLDAAPSVWRNRKMKRLPLAELWQRSVPKEVA